MTATNHDHDGHNHDGHKQCDINWLLSSFVCLFISLTAYILITYATGTFVMLMMLDCLCMTLLDDVEYINDIHVEIVFIQQKGLDKYIRSTA